MVPGCSLNGPGLVLTLVFWENGCLQQMYRLKVIHHADTLTKTDKCTRQCMESIEVVSYCRIFAGVTERFNTCWKNVFCQRFQVSDVAMESSGPEHFLLPESLSKSAYAIQMCLKAGVVQQCLIYMKSLRRFPGN